MGGWLGRLTDDRNFIDPELLVANSNSEFGEKDAKDDESLVNFLGNPHDSDSENDIALNFADSHQSPKQPKTKRKRSGASKAQTEAKTRQSRTFRKSVSSGNLFAHFPKAPRKHSGSKSPKKQGVPKRSGSPSPDHVSSDTTGTTAESVEGGSSRENSVPMLVGKFTIYFSEVEKTCILLTPNRLDKSVAEIIDPICQKRNTFFSEFEAKDLDGNSVSGTVVIGQIPSKGIRLIPKKGSPRRLTRVTLIDGSESSRQTQTSSQHSEETPPMTIQTVRFETPTTVSRAESPETPKEQQLSFMDVLGTSPDEPQTSYVSLKSKQPEVSFMDMIRTNLTRAPSEVVIKAKKKKPKHETGTTPVSEELSPVETQSQSLSPTPINETPLTSPQQAPATLHAIQESSSREEDQGTDQATSHLQFDLDDFRSQVLLISPLQSSSSPVSPNASAKVEEPPSPPRSPFLSKLAEESPFNAQPNETWESLHLRAHLEDPLGYFYFQECLKSHYAEENLIFWTSCHKLRTATADCDVPKCAEEIYRTFFAIDCTTELNVSHAKRQMIMKIAESNAWSRDMYDRLCFETFRQLQQFWIQNYREDFRASIYYKNYVCQRMGLPLIPYDPPGSLTTIF